MTEEIAVYKLQEWDMGNGEKKYSQLGSLEAHYYFAKIMVEKFYLRQKRTCTREMLVICY